MSASAKKAKIKAPVGVSPRPEASEGPKVKNAPADVMVVQKLLCAYGLKVAVTGRASEKFTKAIKAFRKKNGFKYPDGVIDPGQRTFKRLVKKASSGKGGGDEIDCYQILIKGKVHKLSEKDFNRAVADICKKLARVHAAMKSQCETIQQNADFYTNAATGANGFMDALVMWSSSLRADIKEPYFPKGPTAWGALRRAEKAIQAKDVAKAVDLMQNAKKAVNAFGKEVQAYGDKFAGGAKNMQEDLELARDSCFELATYIAAGYIMARTKASPTEAKASAGAIFGFVKSASTQYGRSIAGYNDSAAETFGVIMFDTVAAGAKGGLNAKFFDKIGTSVVTKLVGKPPFKQIGQTALQKFVKKWSYGAGKQAVTELFEAVILIVRDAGKAYGVKGKNYDWGKEIEKKLVDGLFKSMTAGVPPVSGKLSASLFSL